MFGMVLDGIKGFIVVLTEGPSVCVDTVVVLIPTEIDFLLIF